MPARTLYPNRTTMDWSASTWKETDDLPEGTAPKPIAMDTVVSTGNSGTVQMDEDSAVIADFTLGGGTLDGNDGTQWELYTSGDVTYSAGTVPQLQITMSGTKNIDWFTGDNKLTALTTAGAITVTGINGQVYTKKLTLNNASTLAGVQFRVFAAPIVYIISDVVFCYIARSQQTEQAITNNLFGVIFHPTRTTAWHTQH